MHQAIVSYRNPFRQMSEIVINFSQGEMERRVLTRRYEEYLQPAERDLRKCEILASILWEEEASLRMNKLTDCISDLAHHTREYVNRADTEWQAEEQTHTYVEAESAVKVPSITKGKDWFGETVAEAVRELEEFLKPKLATYLRDERIGARRLTLW